MTREEQRKFQTKVRLWSAIGVVLTTIGLAVEMFYTVEATSRFYLPIITPFWFTCATLFFASHIRLKVLEKEEGNERATRSEDQKE